VVTQTETRAGEVTRVSGYGFQLNGQTRWYNLSKFVKDLVLPAVGDFVEISLNRGYVVQIAKQADPPGLAMASPAPSPLQPTSQALAPLAAIKPPAPEPDELPFEPLAAPPFLDPDTLPFDEPLEDALEESPADAAGWEPTPYGGSAFPSRPEKDTQVLRMHALTSAVAILSSGGRSCDADEVLQLAAKLEAWVDR
jgi:hypothetical protein